MPLIAAADIGGTTIKLALVKGPLFLAKSVIPADASAGLGPALERMITAWTELCATAQIPFCEIAAFGLSFPGIVEPGKERVWITPAKKFADAPKLDLRQWARDRLGRPIVVANDAKAALTGEWRFGAAQGVANAAMMTLGTGVGTAVIINGALLHGTHGLAGNAGGHVTIDRLGMRCICGNIGCVESEGSSWALALQAAAHPGFASSALAAFKPLDYKALFETAKAGDAVAAELLERSLRAWAIGATNLVNSFDPEILIIGGGISAAADTIIPYLSTYIRRHSWAQWEVPVLPAQLGNDAGLLGIAHLTSHAL